MHEQLPLPSPRRGSRPPAGAEPLLDAIAVAEWLQVTTSWVYAETRAGRLPHVNLGRYYRYRRSALEAWMENQEHR